MFRNINATKKVVRKVVPKTTSKVIRYCLTCGKTGHIKVNCHRLKRVKKVNYVQQDKEKDPEDSEEECIVEEKDDSEEQEIEDDEKNDDSKSARNCYAVRKK